MVSLIVPVYNCEKSLERCVRSILAQTYENIQLILVDDGSADGSGVLCDRLAAEDGRITVIHKENGGPSSARNRGLEAAKGTYIQFVDSDDCIDPDMTRRLVERMRSRDVQLVVCGYIYTYPDREEYQRFPEAERIPVEELNSRIPNFSAHYFPNTLWNKLYLRSFCDHRFDETLRLGEDMVFILRYLRKIRAVSVIDFCPVHYTVGNPGSITGRVGLYRFTDPQVFFREARAFYGELGWETAIRQTARHCMEIFVYSLLSVLADASHTKTLKKRLITQTLATDTVAEIFSLAEMSRKQRLVAFFIRHRCYSALRLMATVYERKNHENQKKRS